MERHEIIIIGAGPAGLAAAAAAHRAGARDILLLEREERAGGILNQCVHNGFGLHRYHEELTGPEYAQRALDEVNAQNIPIQTGVMVIDLSADRIITCTSRTHGLVQIEAGAVILAMGCRERPRGALNIPGFRPAGIYSAGTAQRLINIEGILPGREVVILGSGDIGLIMARRLTLEGAHVHAVAELMPYSSGLNRNIVQCLNDFDIPLKLCHTVIDIRGKDRVEGVVLAKVDENRRPIPGTEKEIACDTLLLSVGLLPENELSELSGVKIDPQTQGPVVSELLETSVPGIFACGNVLHVHDLVDHVSAEADLAGRAAAEYLKTGAHAPAEWIQLVPGDGIVGIVPQHICLDTLPEKLNLRFRVNRVARGARLTAEADGKRIASVRRRVMTPGEMEQFTLSRDQLSAHMRQIRIGIEEE